MLYFFYFIVFGRISVMKLEDNDRFEKVVENVIVLDKRMVIKICVDIECNFYMKLKVLFEYLIVFDVL